MSDPARNTVVYRAVSPGRDPDSIIRPQFLTVSPPGSVLSLDKAVHKSARNWFYIANTSGKPE